MAKLPTTWKATLHAAGGDALSPRARAALVARLRRFGYVARAHNYGRLQCRLPPPHFHGQADADGVLRCTLERGYYVRIWPSDAEGMRRLVSLMGRDPTTPLAGFRSVYDAGGGTPEHDDLGGIDQTASIWDRLEEAALLTNPLTAPIGIAKLAADETKPNDAAEHAFQVLSIDWLAFEGAGGVPRPPWEFLTPQHDAWVKFRDAWFDGHPDVTALSAMANEADTVRKYLAEKDPGWNDVEHVPVPDVTQLTPTLKAADTISKNEKALERSAKNSIGNLWDGVPIGAKVGGAAVLALLVVIAVRR